MKMASSTPVANALLEPDPNGLSHERCGVRCPTGAGCLKYTFLLFNANGPAENAHW